MIKTSNHQIIFTTSPPNHEPPTLTTVQYITYKYIDYLSISLSLSIYIYI